MIAVQQVTHDRCCALQLVAEVRTFVIVLQVVFVVAEPGVHVLQVDAARHSVLPCGLVSLVTGAQVSAARFLVVFLIHRHGRCALEAAREPWCPEERRGLSHDGC